MLSEWHLPPDYIVNNWTDELLNLMINKLVERKQRLSPVTQGEDSGKVSDETLFACASNLIKVKKNGN